MSLGHSWLVQRSRFHSFRLFVEALEDRTLLSLITAPSYPAGINPSSVAVGDFNGDGIPDLAVANLPYASGTVSILLGKGDSTFTDQRRIAHEPSELNVSVGG